MKNPMKALIRQAVADQREAYRAEPLKRKKGGVYRSNNGKTVRSRIKGKRPNRKMVREEGSELKIIVDQRVSTITYAHKGNLHKNIGRNRLTAYMIGLLKTGYHIDLSASLGEVIVFTKPWQSREAPKTVAA